MPQAEPQINGNTSHVQAQTSTTPILPGTTFPEKPSKPETSPAGQPISTSGPLVHNLPTILTLFTPAQLSTSPLYRPLCKVINTAFSSQGHSLNGRPVVTVDRLTYDDQFLDELGAGVGTFTFVLHSPNDDAVLATASAKRYLGKVQVAGEQDLMRSGNTFTRFGAVGDGKEMWELSTMAVDSGLQKQGIAGFLMGVTEAEVRRRFGEGMVEAEEGTKQKKLIMAITTIKEVNEGFYARRGFQTDYEVAFPVGHLRSQTGFTITHMSKELAVDNADACADVDGR